MNTIEVTPTNSQIFIDKANRILSVYEGNTNQLKRHLFDSLALASESGTENLAAIANAHKLINELIDALDPLLDKYEPALDANQFYKDQK